MNGLAIALALSAAVLLVGVTLRVVIRASPSDADQDQWRRVVPYIYLGCGLVLLVAGGFSFAGIVSVVEMLAGATIAGNGVYLAVRNHVKRP